MNKILIMCMLILTIEPTLAQTILPQNGSIVSTTANKISKQDTNPFEYSIRQKIAGRLKTYEEKRPFEKVYLHFDKPYYVAGDTIYFKAYVTLGTSHRLTDLSGVLHVVFISGENKIEKAIKLQIIDGVANGDFALPDSLPQGSYKVCAYTRLMQNYPDNFFNQVIPIISLFKTAKINSTVISHRDVQFFPEGGTFIIGVRSKVAFKAIDENGLGIKINGVVMDEGNHNVVFFESTHLGMGYFNLTPEAGKMYWAHVTYSNGEKASIPLPKPDLQGITLSLNNDSLPTATVKIEANQAYFKDNKSLPFTLLICSGAKKYIIACPLDTSVIMLSIVKRRLQTGVTTVTLISPVGEQLCERLLFIQNYDQLSLSVNSNKKNYTAREQTILNVNAKTRADEPAIGHFSVSVIDESKIAVDENSECSILSNLLLTSELKGKIEDPNYYFNNINEKTLAGLDLVMLTHGYRYFNWKQIFSTVNATESPQPEKTLEINGFVKGTSGKPLLNAIVTLISQKDGLYLNQLTDCNGKFHFTGLIFSDSDKFILQAVDASGKDNTQTNIDKDTQPATISEPVNLIDRPSLNLTRVVPYQLNNRKVIVLNEVIIKDKALRKSDDYRSSTIIGPGHADQLITHKALEAIGGVKLSEILNGKLKRGIHFVGGQPEGLAGKLKILMDGVEVSNIDDINWHDVENIELFFGANASIFGGNGSNGVLAITTKQGGSEALQKNILKKNMLIIRPQGFYKARNFYTPKYTSTISTGTEPDKRTTIYWNPNLITDKDGNVSFRYYNADTKGTYRMVIEGIDINGNLGRQVYRFQVN